MNFRRKLSHPKTLDVCWGTRRYLKSTNAKSEVEQIFDPSLIPTTIMVFILTYHRRKREA